MKPTQRAAAERYRSDPAKFYYACGKLALDPAYPAVAEALRGSRRPLLDIGCGMGLLVAFLRAEGHRGAVCGIDTDAEKIALAREVFAGDDTAEFLVGDAENLPAHVGDVVMLDVLHYFDDDGQRRLLGRVAEAVGSDGVGLIRIGLRDRSWRYGATVAEEWVVKLSRWIPVSGWNFPTRAAVEEPLRAAGLEVTCAPAWGFTPFNSYLFVAGRKNVVMPSVLS